MLAEVGEGGESLSSTGLQCVMGYNCVVGRAKESKTLPPVLGFESITVGQALLYYKPLSGWWPFSSSRNGSSSSIWRTEVFGSEPLTGALLDGLTRNVSILEMDSDSYRPRHSRQNAASQSPGSSDDV